MNRPVCSYVQPLRCGRLLENPRQAARFVSLIKYDKPAVVGSSDRSERWQSFHSLLAANKGVCYMPALDVHVSLDDPSWL